MNNIIKKVVVEKTLKDVILINHFTLEWQENKFNSVEYFQEVWDAFSYREIANLTGVSQDFLKNLRRKDSTTPIPFSLFLKLKKIKENINNIYL